MLSLEAVFPCCVVLPCPAAGLPLTDWRVFPLPLTNVADLKLPDVSKSNASSGAAAAPAHAAGASASFEASAKAEAACGAAPAAAGTAAAPSPATAGPTFYR